MRLYEFDNSDDLAHSFEDKYNRKIEQRMSDIEEEFIKDKILYDNFKIKNIGTQKNINDILESLIDEVKNFYNFCNKCADDSTTRTYLDRLIQIHDELSTIIDSV